MEEAGEALLQQAQGSEDVGECPFDGPRDDERNQDGQILGDLPLDWRSKSQQWEAKQWWSVCWPTCILFFSGQSQNFIDMAFLGHLAPNPKDNVTSSSDYLSASSKSGILFDITLAIFTRGSLQVLTVLCSQAYGSKNYKLVGYWLQLSMIMMVVMAIPVIFLWWYAADVLDAVFGMSESQRALVSTFSRISILRLFPELFNGCLSQFCLAQKIIKPFIVTSLTAVFLNICLNQLYIHGLFGVGGLGFKGSPMATSTTSFIVFSMNCFYVFRIRKGTKCWPGWSRNSFNVGRLNEFVKQTIPLTIATCLEDFQIQAINSFAVVLGHRQVDGEWIIGAHNGLLTFLMNVLSIQWGVLKATSLRAGHFIGSNDSKRAKLVAKIAFVFSTACGTLMTITLLALDHQVGKLYSNDQRVIDEVAKLIVPLSLGMIPLSLFYVSMALLDAMGRPNVVAVSFFLGAWVVSVPTSYYLGLHTDLGLQGLWYGIIFGYSVTAFTACYSVARTNWVEVLNEAKRRNELGDSVSNENILDRDAPRGVARRDSAVQAVSPALYPFPSPVLTVA